MELGADVCRKLFPGSEVGSLPRAGYRGMLEVECADGLKVSTCNGLLSLGMKE